MSVLISVPIGMAISQYSNLNHACAVYRLKQTVRVKFSAKMKRSATQHFFHISCQIKRID